MLVYNGERREQILTCKETSMLGLYSQPFTAEYYVILFLEKSLAYLKNDL